MINFSDGKEVFLFVSILRKSVLTEKYTTREKAKIQSHIKYLLKEREKAISKTKTVN